MTKQTICVILGQQRSGTTVFRRLLESNKFHSIGEIFYKDQISQITNFHHFLLQKINEDRRLIHPSRHIPVFKDFFDQLERDVATEKLLLAGFSDWGR